MPENNKDKNSNSTADEQVENESTTDEESQGKIKNWNLKKILIYVAVFLVLILAIISILYIFTSSKEEKEKQDTVETKVQDTPKQPSIEQQQEEVAPKEESYNFDFNSLDPDKLNEQLALLTSKNIEQNRLKELEAKNGEKSLEQNKENKEQPIAEENKDTKTPLDETTKEATNTEQNTQEANENNTITPTTQQPIQEDSIATTQNDNNFIKLINIAKIKGELKKSFLDKVISINPNVHLCRDTQNNIELYFGPFENDDKRKELFKKLISKDFKQAYELEMTQEEFNKSCNY